MIIPKALPIRLDLIDGDTQGVIFCQIDNHIGKLLKIPKLRVQDFLTKDTRCDQKLCIYILFGKDGEIDTAFIGKSENISERVKQHIVNKLFWNDIVILYHPNNKLDKEQSQYIKNKLINDAQKIDRYNIINAPQYSNPIIPNSKILETNQFIEDIKVITSILGHKIFETRRNENKNNAASPIYEERPTTENIVTLSLKTFFNINAKGQQTNEGFVVFTDSQIKPTIEPTLSENLQIQRKILIEQGIIKQNCFVKDHVFITASVAASIICGENVNGRTVWVVASSNRELCNFELLSQHTAFDDKDDN